MKRPFYSYDPEDGFETHATAEEARARAQDAIDAMRDDAAEGWDELVTQVSWGRVLAETREVPGSRKPAEPGSPVDELVDYDLHPVDEGGEIMRTLAASLGLPLGLLLPDAASGGALHPSRLPDWPDWQREADLEDGRQHWTLRDPMGRKRADVWGGTWHTWDEDGVGGENGVEYYAAGERSVAAMKARVEAAKAIKRQGWAT